MVLVIKQNVAANRIGFVDFEYAEGYGVGGFPLDASGAMFSKAILRLNLCIPLFSENFRI
jgi:hypothetical protein